MTAVGREHAHLVVKQTSYHSLETVYRIAGIVVLTGQMDVRGWRPGLPPTSMSAID
jgi:hypothetical protein